MTVTHRKKTKDSDQPYTRLFKRRCEQTWI